jgi:hypothetical protein
MTVLSSLIAELRASRLEATKGKWTVGGPESDLAGPMILNQHHGILLRHTKYYECEADSAFITLAANKIEILFKIIETQSEYLKAIKRLENRGKNKWLAEQSEIECDRLAKGEG